MQKLTSISSGDLSSNLSTPNPKILIVSKRNTGKSSLMANHLSRMKDIDPENVVIVSPGDRITSFYASKNKLWEIKYSFENMEAVVDKLISKPSVLILDDAIPLKTKGSRETYKMLEYMLEGLVNTTIMISCQFPHFDEYMYNYFDYIFVGKEDFKSTIDKMYNHFGNRYESLDRFKKDIVSLKAYNFLCLKKDDEDDLGYKLKEIKFNDLNISVNDHICILNSNDSINVIIVNNIIKKLENIIEEVFVIRRDTQLPSNVLEDILKEINCKKKKLLIIEYKFADLSNNFSSLMDEIMGNARHYGITLVLVENYVVKMSAHARGNIDRWIIGNYYDKPSLQKLYDGVLGMFPCFSDVKMLMSFIENNKLLHINQGGIHEFDEKVNIVEMDPSMKSEKYPFVGGKSVRAVGCVDIDIRDQLKLMNEKMSKIMIKLGL